MSFRSKQLLVSLLVVMLVGVGGLVSQSPRQVRAAEPLCFDHPDITNCVDGTFRTYWEEAGGLPTFGYPISAARDEQTPDGIFFTQHFERERMEFHPENPAPYKVQLGLLGRELYGPSLIPPDQPERGCEFFEVTGYNVCEPFLTRWQTAGSTPGRSSLDLYGLPISPLILGEDTEGNEISVQWFERARFELHGDSLVLLGLLGLEQRDRQNQPPPPPPEIPPPPAQEPPTQEPPTQEPPTPTAHPAPIEAPFPQIPCDERVPDPVEGIQAWAIMPVVGPPFDAVICVRLIVNGEPAHPAFVRTFRSTPSGVIASEMHTTHFEGVVDFIFYVGNIPGGTVVPVEAVATFAGKEYRTTINIQVQ